MAEKINIDFNGQATGFVGSTDSGFGVPASDISIQGGGQIQTISEWTSEGFQVPVYAYVANGIPRATLTAERGVSTLDGNEPAECSATFVSIGGGTTTISIAVGIPDPTAARSAGSGGASFTWIAESSGDDPYSAVSSS